MPKFINVTRNDVSGGYTQPLSEVLNALDGEFDGIDTIPNGTTIILKVVEMSQKEYDELPEFMGW